MNLQPFKRRRTLPQPRPMRLHTGATILTLTMLLLHTINDQIRNRHTLLGEKRKISLRLENAHRLRNCYERETRLLSIVKHRAHGFDPLAQIAQKDIDLIGNHAPTCKVGDHVTMLLTHQIHRSLCPLENFRQTQQSRRMSRRRSIHDDVRVLPFTIQLAQLKQRHHFIESGQRKSQQLLDVFLVEQSSALRNLGQHLAMRVAKPFERKTRVHLVSKQTRAAKLFYFDQSITDPDVETIGKRVRGISGKKKDGFVSFKLIEEIESGWVVLLLRPLPEILCASSAVSCAVGPVNRNV